MRIAFIGCGAAGRPLGRAWAEAGHEIGAVVCRTRGREAVEEMGYGDTQANPRDADVVVFATPDDVLSVVAGRYALGGEQVAVHLSGAHPSTVLAPTGARTASVHPLRAFADFESSLAALPDTWFFVEGDPVAERLAGDLGGHVARIDTESKVLYHAGAAIASNYVVALIAQAQALFGRAGVGADDAAAALVSLARSAVDNVDAVGLPLALTGPIARGDVDLVRRHLEALEGESRDLYRALLRATLPIARAKGGLPADAERELDEL